MARDRGRTPVTGSIADEGSPSTTSSARRFFQTSAVYFLGATLAKVATFFLLPVYTAVLPPDDFGDFDFWTNLVSFAAPIAFFQVWDAVYRFHFDSEMSREQVVSNGYVLMAWGCMAYSVTVLPILVISTSAPAALTFAVGLALCLQLFYGYFARSELKNGLFVGTGILNTAVSATASLGLLLGLGFGIESLYIGMIVGNLAQSVVLAARLRPGKWFKRDQIDVRLQRKLLRFSLPLCVASAAYWLLAGFTRLEIIHYLGPVANGYFAVAMRFAVVVVTVSSVFLYAWNELLYSTRGGAGEGSAKSKGPTLALRASISSAAGTILLVNVGFEILVSSRYAEARSIVPIVIIGTALNSVSSFVGSLFMAEVRTKWLLWTTAMASALNVALGIPATQLFGVGGASLALTVSFGVLMLARIELARKLFGVRTIDADVLVPSALLVLALVVYYLEASLLFTAAAVGIVAVQALHGLLLKRERAGETV
jgi:O-antigen/teichoic acid export membrane protein